MYNKALIVTNLYFIKQYKLIQSEFTIIFDYIIKKLSVIKEDNRLKMYQKILLMEQFQVSSLKFISIKDF